MAKTKSVKARKKAAKKLAVVASELCGICQACATVCPTGAIDVFENFVKVLSVKCTGCGTCVKVCPVGAITLAAG